MAHISVLLQEAIDGLNIKEGEIFLDATLGSAGHSLEVAKRLGGNVTIVGLDVDAEAIKRSQATLDAANVKATLIETNFKDLDSALKAHGIEKIDKALFDLGFSSVQMDDSGRGFTFQKDEPLLMTLKANPGEDDLTAAKIINSWPEEQIANLIFEYGEERFSRSIARGIVEARKSAKITSTQQLVDIILASTPKKYHHGRIHPATRTFQALRIATNEELDALSTGLKKTFELLSPGGRMAVISFHSLEDRIVKTYFRGMKDDGKAVLITKKPITAGDEEIEHNRRARSAKLRILEKTSTQ